jgi:TP901 family phage tail tape measure protein
MATIASLIVKVGADVGGLDSGLNSAQAKVRKFGSDLRNIGAGMTAGITAPLLGIVAAADRAGTALDERMGNVQSLGLTIDRTRELKTVVQETSIATAKGTTEMADGLYQVVSAFGDTAETAALLEINAKAAAAGLSTITDAVDLTSAVTKGYDTVNAEAVRHASDLAFITVKLGQTTFPDLAKSIGKVVPLAANLGISQEELFAVFAAGTGVTGGAAEVATQYRGALQALMVPTADMTKLLERQGVVSGAALIEQKGLGDTIALIVEEATRAGVPLQKYISSIEGQTLALALAGPLADDYVTKLQAMMDAAGATDAAFAAQTQGINANGFAAEKAKVKWEVFLQKINEGLGPAKSAVLDALGPITDRALEFADAFANLDPNTQKWIVGIAGIVAAAGPALIVIGSLVTAMAAIGLWGLLAGGAMIALAAVVVANWDTIKTTTQEAVAAMAPQWERFQGWIQAATGWDLTPKIDIKRGEGYFRAQIGKWFTATNLATGPVTRINVADWFDYTDIGPSLQIALGHAFATVNATTGRFKINIGEWFEVNNTESGVLRARIGDAIEGALIPGVGSGSISIGDWFDFAKLQSELRLRIGEAVSGALNLDTGAFTLRVGKVDLSSERLTQIRTELVTQLGVQIGKLDLDWASISTRVTGELNKVKLGVMLALATGGEWANPAAVQGWWERSTAGIRAELDRLMTGDTVLTRSLATAQGALDTIQATMAGTGGLSAAQQFSAAVSVVTIALSALGEIKADALTTAVTAVAGLATALINLGTAGVEQLDPEKMAGAALALMNPWGPLIEALTNVENLAALGAAYGKFVTTVAEKLGGVLASDEFGTQFGVTVGKSVAQLARGAAALVKGFMDQITLTDITTYQAQVDTFVANFVGGVVEGIKSVDWSIVGEAIKDLILFQMQKWAGDKTMVGMMFPGPVGEAVDVVAKKFGAPTVADYIEQLRKGQVYVVDLTRDADILNTELSKVAQSPLLGPSAQWPGLDMTFGALEAPPAMDVAANVVSVAPATGPLPTVDVAANVTQVAQPTAQFPTMLGLLGGAEEAVGSTLTDAANMLTSFSFEWPQLPEWTWPQLPAFSWPTLPRWSWPSIPSPSWLGRLAVPRPEWLGELLTWSPVVRLQTGGPGPVPELIPGNALGTSNWRGGWSLVGEQGPELAYVPAGARIFNAGETRDLMAAGAPGGHPDVIISMDGAVIRNELDIEALAYRVMQKIRQHGRG